MFTYNMREIIIIVILQANTLAEKANMEEATRLSNNARTFMIISVVLGVIWMIFATIIRTTSLLA